MGRYAIAPTLLILLLTTACSGTSDGDETSPPASAAPSATGSSSSLGAAPSSPATPRAFDLPAKAKILVPVTTGEGSTDLPVFKPESDVYTVYVNCTGKGTMTLVDRNAPDDDPSKIGCNGPTTHGRIYTDVVPQKLAVRTDGGTVHWTLAVISGEHPV
ncbi:hypothetical protein [Streptomyces indiaensis]|uniref:Lipoprotein n=1 Tax=Streptomyces indiaensis TaxID=284033 RepID=A0ABN3DM24_9ACTN|nr:hypothetical protein [Streptomyces indiaensis]MCF1646029.1 hypothetical protein [Streptomyces indiaensis]